MLRTCSSRTCHHMHLLAAESIRVLECSVDTSPPLIFTVTDPANAALAIHPVAGRRVQQHLPSAASVLSHHLASKACERCAPARDNQKHLESRRIARLARCSLAREKCSCSPASSRVQKARMRLLLQCACMRHHLPCSGIRDVQTIRAASAHSLARPRAFDAPKGHMRQHLVFKCEVCASVS